MIYTQGGATEGSANTGYQRRHLHTREQGRRVPPDKSSEKVSALVYTLSNVIMLRPFRNFWPYEPMPVALFFRTAVAPPVLARSFFTYEINTYEINVYMGFYQHRLCLHSDFKSPSRRLLFS